jgi:hypothetical protein
MIKTLYYVWIIQPYWINAILHQVARLEIYS